MTYPVQQPGYPAPQPPQQPIAPQYPAPQGYAPPPMGYPAQQYPAQQPGYPMPPQGYGAPQQPVQLATGSLDAFYSQPSVGGGAALKFEVGTTHAGVVTREITGADIQQQTNPQNQQPAFFKDGRPKFVMKVPLQVQPTADRPDGLAQWYVAGAARDELARAMKAAGAPDGPPEAGSVIQVTCTGTRPSGAGMNPSKVYQVLYQRPQGAAPAQQPPAPQQQFQAQQPEPQHLHSQLPTAQVPVQPQYQQPPAPQQFQAPVPPPQMAQPAAPQFDPSQLPQLDPAQQQLLAGLVGGQQPVPQG